MQHHRVGLARTLPENQVETTLTEVEAFGTGQGAYPAAATVRERAMLDYAMALTHAPASMSPSHLSPMREAGLTDAEILDANQVIAYYAYVNRVVDGLGVQLESPQGEPG